MPNKKISQTILKQGHTGNNNPVTFTQQNHQNHNLGVAVKGRGIHIGSYMDFSASSTGYNEAKRTIGNKPVAQKKPDNLRKHMGAPKHLKERMPHHLFRCDCKRTDADEIVNN